MPSSFPDMDSLKRAALTHNFRLPTDNEPEETYRQELADHVSSLDLIQSEEIRNKVGWDQFDDQQNVSMLLKMLLKNS